MAKKDAYYFPHFSNARNDQKLIKLRRVMGIEGYGLYFMLLEVLRDQDGFKYPLEGIEELAYDWHISKEKIAATISNFNLFEIDHDHFFSLKFNEFMQPYLDKSERARAAINKRWGNTNVLQMNNKSNTDHNTKRGEESKVKDSKVNKSKVKDINNPVKTKFSQYVSMLDSEYDNLIDKHGEESTKRMIEILDNYKGSKGRKYKDDYRAILAWVETAYYKEISEKNDKKLSFTEVVSQW